MNNRIPTDSRNSIPQLVRRDLTRWRRPVVGALTLAASASLVGPLMPLGWVFFSFAALAATLVAAFVLAAAIQADPLRSPDRRVHGQGLSAGAIFTGKVVLAGLLFVPLTLILEVPWVVGFGIPGTEIAAALGAATLAAWLWAVVAVGAAAYLTHSLKAFAAVLIVLLVMGNSINSLISDDDREPIPAPLLARDAPPTLEGARDRDVAPLAVGMASGTPQGVPAVRINHVRVHGAGMGRPDPTMVLVSLDADTVSRAFPGILIEPEVTVVPRGEAPEGSGKAHASAIRTHVTWPPAPPWPSREWISTRPVRWLGSLRGEWAPERELGHGFSVEIPEATARGFRDSGGSVTVSGRLVALEPFLLARLTPHRSRLVDHRIRWRVHAWAVDEEGPRLAVSYRSSRLEEGLPHLVPMSPLGQPIISHREFQYLLHHPERSEALVLRSTQGETFRRRPPSLPLRGRGGQGEMARMTLIPDRPESMDGVERAAWLDEAEWATWLDGAELLVLAWTAGESAWIELEWEDDGTGIHIGY